MSSETGHLSDQPGRDAESALESAARVVRGSSRPAGASPARAREILRRRQERDLLARARENDRLIATPFHISRIEDGGEEHRVWFDMPSQRYFKATHPGRFGFSVVAMPDGTLELTAATPLEYLERCDCRNRRYCCADFTAEHQRHCSHRRRNHHLHDHALVSTFAGRKIGTPRSNGFLSRFGGRRSFRRASR